MQCIWHLFSTLVLQPQVSTPDPLKASRWWQLTHILLRKFTQMLLVLCQLVAPAEGGEPLAGADSHTAAPESMASRSPVHAAAVRQARPSRAAANDVAALLLQQKLDGGLGSSCSGHARTGKLPAALSARLTPKGTVQEAAAAAETVSWRNVAD